MTKDAFIQHMCVLKAISKEYETFFEKLHDMKIDIGSNEHFYKAFDEAIRILAEEVGGKKAVEEDALGYYIFETDWGANGDNVITITDEKGNDFDISLTSHAALYNYLQYLHDMEE